MHDKCEHHCYFQFYLTTCSVLLLSLFLLTTDMSEVDRRTNWPLVWPTTASCPSGEMSAERALNANLARHTLVYTTYNTNSECTA